MNQSTEQPKQSEQTMKQLFEEFNITNDDSKYGSNIALDKNYFEKLAKYDLQILNIVLQKLNEEYDGIYKAILDRRREGGSAKNLVNGFNIINDCITNVKTLIAEKKDIEQYEQHRQKCNKVYNELIVDLIYIFKYIVAMVIIFIILHIFNYIMI